MDKQPYIISWVENALLSFVVASCVCILVVILLRISYNLNEKRRLKLEGIIDDVLDKIITGGPVLNDYTLLNMLKRRKVLFGKAYRQLLIDMLIEVRLNLSGMGDIITRKIYVDCGLHNYSLRKTESSRWHVKVQGLREIILMNYEIPDIDILQFTLSRNTEVASAARCAYLNFSKNDPFRFLDEVNAPLSMLELIEFFRILSESRNKTNSNFSKWIRYSGNRSVVYCCIKLAVYEKQVRAIKGITALLDVDDTDLRAEAIAALGHLRASETKELLMDMYSSEPLKCQSEIIFAIGNMGGEDAIAFIQSEFLTSTSFEIQKRCSGMLSNLLNQQELEIFKNSIEEDKQYFFGINRKLSNKQPYATNYY